MSLGFLVVLIYFVHFIWSDRCSEEFPTKEEYLTRLHSRPEGHLQYEIDYPASNKSVYFISFNRTHKNVLIKDTDFLEEFASSISLNYTLCVEVTSGLNCWREEYSSGTSVNRLIGRCLHRFTYFSHCESLPFTEVSEHEGVYEGKKTFYLLYYMPYDEHGTKDGGDVLYYGGSTGIYFYHSLRKRIRARQNSFFKSTKFELNFIEKNEGQGKNFVYLDVTHPFDYVVHMEDNDNHHLIQRNVSQDGGLTSFKFDRNTTGNSAGGEEEDEIDFYFIKSNNSILEKTVSVKLLTRYDGDTFSGTLDLYNFLKIDNKILRYQVDILKNGKRKDNLEISFTVLADFNAAELTPSYMVKKILIEEVFIDIESLCDYEQNCTENRFFFSSRNNVSCSGCGEKKPINFANFKNSIKTVDFGMGEFLIHLYFNISLYNVEDILIGRLRVDSFIEDVLIPIYNNEKKKKKSPTWIPMIVIISSIVFVGSTVTCTVSGILIVKTGIVGSKLLTAASSLSNIPMLFGKYVITKSGDHFLVVDLSYKFMHKKIKLKKELKRDFISLLRSLRASKYSAYSHCKYCYIEQQEFAKNSKFKNAALYCCKCGMPLSPYVTFDGDEKVCVICSVMNKYDHNNHGRCLLHLSSPSKNVGATYYLYKTMFSVSSASKKKKKSKSLERMKELITPGLWKLNSAMRFEYLFLIQNLIGKELFFPLVDGDGLASLRETIKLAKRRRREINEDMELNYVDHSLKIDDDEICEENKKIFVKNYKWLLTNVIDVLTRHLKIVMVLRDQDKKDKEKKSGRKRKLFQDDEEFEEFEEGEEYQFQSKKRRRFLDVDETNDEYFSKSDSDLSSPNTESIGDPISANDEDLLDSDFYDIKSLQDEEELNFFTIRTYEEEMSEKENQKIMKNKMPVFNVDEYIESYSFEKFDNNFENFDTLDLQI